MRITYPAIFTPFSDGSGGYVVEFPDLSGCVTGGSDIKEAMKMAVDAASGWVLNELEEGRPAPAPSKNIDVPLGSFTKMVLCDIEKYSELYGKNN